MQHRIPLDKTQLLGFRLGSGYAAGSKIGGKVGTTKITEKESKKK